VGHQTNSTALLSIPATQSSLPPPNVYNSTTTQPPNMSSPTAICEVVDDIPSRKRNKGIRLCLFSDAHIALVRLRLDRWLQQNKQYAVSISLYISLRRELASLYRILRATLPYNKLLHCTSLYSTQKWTRLALPCRSLSAICGPRSRKGLLRTTHTRVDVHYQPRRRSTNTSTMNSGFLEFLACQTGLKMRSGTLCMTMECWGCQGLTRGDLRPYAIATVFQKRISHVAIR
jgi:hypothetical protein